MSHFMSLPSNLIGLLTSNSAANAWRARSRARRQKRNRGDGSNKCRSSGHTGVPTSIPSSRRLLQPLAFVGAGAAEDARDADIRLVARELENRAVGLLQIVQRRPWTRPRVRILTVNLYSIWSSETRVKRSVTFTASDEPPPRPPPGLRLLKFVVSTTSVSPSSGRVTCRPTASGRTAAPDGCRAE